jgi:hypothetical protein
MRTLNPKPKNPKAYTLYGFAVFLQTSPKAYALPGFAVFLQMCLRAFV